MKTLDKYPTREPTPDTAAEPIPKVKTEPTPTKHKKSKLKLQQEFKNEIINDEKNTTNEMLSNYIRYHNLLLLINNLINAKQNKNEKLVYNYNINNRLTDLRNNINRKEISENEIRKKVADIVEKILEFNKLQKGYGIPSDFDRTQLKILTPKKMFQRLPIALAQVKTGNASENLLNDIRKTIYSLSGIKLLRKYTKI